MNEQRAGSSSRSRILHILAWLFALAPFALGFIRFATYHRDTRVLALAVASLAGAALARTVMKAKERDPRMVLMESVIVGTTAAIAAFIAAWMLMGKFSVGATMFAVVFGIGWGIASALNNLSKTVRGE